MVRQSSSGLTQNDPNPKLKKSFDKSYSMKIKKHTLNCLIILYCFFILLMSIISFNGNLPLNRKYVFCFRLDYLIHIICFLPWMMLAILGWDGNKKKIIWTAYGVGLGLAIFSELIQIYIPGKVFNPLDMLANIVGVIVGGVSYIVLKRAFSAKNYK